MTDLRYHKGQKCIIGSTFCQEGYCNTCAIQLALSTNDFLIPAEVAPRIVAMEKNRDRLSKKSLQSI